MGSVLFPLLLNFGVVWVILGLTFEDLVTSFHIKSLFGSYLVVFGKFFSTFRRVDAFTSSNLLVNNLFVVLISIVRFFSPWLVIDLFNNFTIIFFADFVYLKFKRAVIDFSVLSLVFRFNNSLSF